MPGYHLAQFNVGRLVHPLGHESNAEFEAALEPINALAEATPGFVWRLTDDDGASSSYVRLDGVDDPREIVNMSVWTDLDSMMHYVTRSGHSSYLRRRREWFEKPAEPVVVCWWIPAGETPTPEEGHRRLEMLRSDGPSQEAWTPRHPFPEPT